jgi:YHS domain-containing protein
MKSLWMAGIVLLAVGLVLWGCGSQKSQRKAETAKKVEQKGGESRAGTQTTCPVMGGAINRNIYTDYEGKRIYFCCPVCIEEFKKDPQKYLQKMEQEGVVLETAPGT